MQLVMDEELTTSAVLRAALVCGLALLWTGFFWFKPLSDLSFYQQVYSFIDDLILRAVGGRGRARWAIASYVFVLTPVVVLWLAGHPPKALGLGRMATHGWRIVALGFAIALPFLIVLGLSDEVQRYYASFHWANGWVDIVSSAFVVVVEHIFIEGLVLALALPSGGLHAIEEPTRRGPWAWLGFGLPPGQRGWLAWLGIPAGAWPALIGQALLFGLVHSGKASSEVLMAFPGGLGLGMLTYRIRSVWPGVLLHLGTSAIILLTAMAASG